MVEFVLGLMITISFFFFYVKMSAVFAIGNYIHYATFMSARALSSSAATEDAQLDSAQAVLESMVMGHFKNIIQARKEAIVLGQGEFSKANPVQDNWGQGVSYPFKAKLSLYPFSNQGQSIEMELTSNSFMPREDSADECLQKKGLIQKYISAKGKLNNIDLYWDNGGHDGC